MDSTVLTEVQALRVQVDELRTLVLQLTDPTKSVAQSTWIRSKEALRIYGISSNQIAYFFRKHPSAKQVKIDKQGKKQIYLNRKVYEEFISPTTNM